MQRLDNPSNQTPDVYTFRRAHARLRELIMDGALLPNTHHDETRLALQVNVDANHLRLAAHQLQSEGLVRVSSRGGFWVLPLSADEVASTFSQVAILEARAVYSASLHAPTSIGMAALDDAVMTMEDAFYRNNNKRWAAACHHFHRSLVQCSGQASLIRMALSRSEAVHRARMVSLTLRPPRFETVENHARLLAAVRRGAADEARSIHLAHWRTERDEIVQLIREHGIGRVTD